MESNISELFEEYIFPCLSWFLLMIDTVFNKIESIWYLWSLWYFVSVSLTVYVVFDFFKSVSEFASDSVFFGNLSEGKRQRIKRENEDEYLKRRAINRAEAEARFQEHRRLINEDSERWFREHNRNVERVSFDVPQKKASYDIEKAKEFDRTKKLVYEKKNKTESESN